MRWLPRMWWWMRRPWMRWLSRLRRLQSLPMWRRLWRLWWLRRWLDRCRCAVGSNRLLCILGPVPLVLGGDAF